MPKKKVTRTPAAKPRKTDAQKSVASLLRSQRAKKAPRGRPMVSTFTKEREAVILDALRKGLFRYNAAAIAGVSERTMKRWVARGRDNLSEIEAWEDAAESAETDETDGEDLGECPEINKFGRFVIAVSIAEAAAEAESLLTIQNAGIKDWRAAAWYLERKYNKRYGSGALRTDLPTEDDFVDDDMSEIEAQFLERITTIETRIERVGNGSSR